jgi:hypothetical protein
MSNPIKIQILKAARSLIEDKERWCPGQLARDSLGRTVRPTDSTAVQRCALGALVAAAHEFTADSYQAHELATAAMRPLIGATTLTHINDVEGHAAVLALFDAAISAADHGLTRLPLSEPA